MPLQSGAEDTALGSEQNPHQYKLEVTASLDDKTQSFPLKIGWFKAQILSKETLFLIKTEQAKTQIPFVIWIAENHQLTEKQNFEVRRLVSRLKKYEILVEIQTIDPNLLDEPLYPTRAVFHDLKNTPRTTLQNIVKKTFMKPTAEDFMVGSIAGLATLATSGTVWFGLTSGISPWVAAIATSIQTGIIYTQFLFVRSWDRLYSSNYGLIKSINRGKKISWAMNFIRRQTLTFGVTHLINLISGTMTMAETIELVAALGGGSAFFQTIRNKVFPDTSKQSRKQARWSQLNTYLLAAPFALANTAGLTGPTLFDLKLIGFPEMGFHSTPMLVFSLYFLAAAVIKFKPDIMKPIMEWEHKKLLDAYQFLTGRPFHENPCHMLMSVI